ncbi:hypothetical protein LRK44_03815 [Rhodanobacter denitrificans]|uniref:hypothetical protein n=1 Tax=Rhodanobacter sp. OR92 TaxID=1076524 RepID=UPI0012DF020C|nr:MULTISPECIES: hypothetical protein [Rhodanobacter]UJM94570.1 hypothetical protein LRK32_03810 [Rhodanobacter denitrificans]UJM98100.1 hypothetical protein LRK44_03815 [Rhodanobacter denitrificans]
MLRAAANPSAKSPGSMVPDSETSLVPVSPAIALGNSPPLPERQKREWQSNSGNEVTKTLATVVVVKPERERYMPMS